MCIFIPTLALLQNGQRAEQDAEWHTTPYANTKDGPDIVSQIYSTSPNCLFKLVLLYHYFLNSVDPILMYDLKSFH